VAGIGVRGASKASTLPPRAEVGAGTTSTATLAVIGPSSVGSTMEAQ
jgi:hypothetical protein